MDVMIKAEGLNLTIAGRVILDNLNFSLPANKIIGLLGPNGSGKTSLLKILAAINQPTSGSIQYASQELASIPRKQLAQRLAFVSQNNQTFTNLTVEQIVSLGRIPFKKRLETLNTHDYKIIQDALILTNIQHLAHRYWQNLSGGEKQRVHIARALAQQPKELFLDEPNNHLDIKHQIGLLELLSSLNISVLISLHDLNLALKYCDYILILKQGKLHAIGATTDILTCDIIQQVYDINCKIYQKDDDKYIYF